MQVRIRFGGEWKEVKEGVTEGGCSLFPEDERKSLGGRVVRSRLLSTPC
jgi:hypothetical protein